MDQISGSRSICFGIEMAASLNSDTGTYDVTYFLDDLTFFDPAAGAFLPSINTVRGSFWRSIWGAKKSALMPALRAYSREPYDAGDLANEIVRSSCVPFLLSRQDGDAVVSINAVLDGIRDETIRRDLQEIRDTIRQAISNAKGPKEFTARLVMPDGKDKEVTLKAVSISEAEKRLTQQYRNSKLVWIAGDGVIKCGGTTVQTR